MLPTGNYGCCLLPNAICCSDQLHCCPNGYKCNNEQGSCDSENDNSTVSFSDVQVKEPEVETKVDVNSVVCPDGCSFCPNSYTCCKMCDGSYGCCPLPNVNIFLCPLFFAWSKK